MGKTTGQPLLKLGSQGDDVKKLKQSLIDAGYDVGRTGADGILGKMYAVTADGDVANSRDPLNSKKPKQEPKQEEVESNDVQTVPTFNYNQSATVTAANQLLADQWNSMPGAYQSQWQNQINTYMSKIENRDPFSYNFNEDGLYQMYKDHYTQMGQMAMMDTMGQAAAMTGGYGNSYAQTVGQQAYNQQLTQLNNIIPELYQMAYARYRDEGQDLLNMYNMYMDRENQDYGRYQDELSNWWKETDYLAGRADTAWEQNRLTELDDYNQGRDAISDQQGYRDWLTGAIGSGYEPTDEDLAAAGMTKEQADALKNAYTTSLNSNTGNGNGNGDDTTKYDALGYEDQKKWEKDFSKATTYSELERVGDRMQHAGVDPQVVADWVDYYANLLGLVPENNQQMSKPTTGGLGGGGGGGRIMIEAW